MTKLFFFILFFPQLLFANQSLTIALGAPKTIPLKGSSNVWIEDKKVLQATASGSQLIIKGSSTGESLLRIGQANYLVQVVHPAQIESMERLQKALRSMVGLHMRAEKGQMSIKGTLYSLQDWQKLAKQQLKYVMRAQISPSLQEQAQKYFSALFKNSHLPVVNVIFSNAAEVRIHPKSNHLAKYTDLLSDYGIQVTKDSEALESAPTIKVQITVAEVSKRFIQNYGIQWPNEYQAQILGPSDLSDKDLSVLAHAMESNSYGKILASPNIVCRSGKEAEFLAGGEIPIMMKSYKTQEVIWKRYGILLKVKPQADSSGRMSISIETEVSTLDSGNKIGDIPGILTNRVSSHFDLNKAQTIALSGLIKSEDSQGAVGLPLLSRLPILGPLFSSRSFNEQKSELVIFVRPTILDAETPSTPQKHLGDIQWK